MTITDIYESQYLPYRKCYIGKLRNEKRFNLHDEVFIGWSKNVIFKTKIVGVEFLPQENPEYFYSIQLPDNVDRFFDEVDRCQLKCDRIFNSIEEVKESQIQALENAYELEKKSIELFFKQFEKP